MRFFGMTDIGKVRKSNQDCFYIDEKNKWCVIADGMGGHKGGEMASKLAVSIIKQNMLLESDAEEDLRASIMNANKAVFNESIDDSNLTGMGTTVVVIRFDKDIAYIAHVGDSRAYYINGEDIIQLTKDHSVVQQLIESGTITRKQARNHPQKNLITRAVGTDIYTEIDINRAICTKGDYILLCTDGLSSFVDDDEILKIVMKNSENAVENLIAAANNAGGGDNITAILIEL